MIFLGSKHDTLLVDGRKACSSVELIGCSGTELISCLFRSHDVPAHFLAFRVFGLVGIALEDGI
jgi:hypothetical protein